MMLKLIPEYDVKFDATLAYQLRWEFMMPKFLSVHATEVEVS